jgi:hypothetical protein
VKIELNLLDMHHAYPDVGRSVLVALMSLLPQDEVELAVAEWRAVLRVREADDEVAIEDAIGEMLAEPGISVDVGMIGGSKTPEPEQLEQLEPDIPFPPAKEKPARARKKAAEPQPNGADEPAQPPPPDGQVNRFADLDLRQLCRRAEHEVGRDKVISVLDKHMAAGQRLSDLDSEIVAALRADVEGLLG